MYGDEIDTKRLGAVMKDGASIEQMFEAMTEFENTVTIDDFKKWFDKYDLKLMLEIVDKYPHRKIGDHPMPLGEHLYFKFLKEHNSNVKSFFFGLHPSYRDLFCTFLFDKKINEYFVEEL